MAGAWMRLVVLLCGVHRTIGVRIINCNNNKVEIFEDSPVPVTCGDILSTADVYWRRGDGVNIGECRADGTAGTCPSDLYNDYRLSRSPQSTESQLTLVPDYRRHAGVTVTCLDRMSDSTASCTFVIKRHSVLSECHVTTNPVDWTVSGSCRVQQAFSSDNIYTCTWTRNDGQTFGEFDASRELCSFTQALPQAGGLYTYSISVSPPATTAFSQQLTLGPGNFIVVSTSDSPSSTSAVVGSVIGPVVGAAVAVVVTAVIAILLVILIRRRRRKLKKAREKTNETKTLPCQNSEFEDHINEVYDSSETAGPHSSCGDNYRSRGQGTDREASHRNKQKVSAQYEDSPSGGYYSEIREVGTGNTYPQPHHRLTMSPYSN